MIDIYILKCYQLDWIYVNNNAFYLTIWRRQAYLKSAQ